MRIIFYSGVMFVRILAFFALASIMIWVLMPLIPTFASYFSQAINLYPAKENMGQNYISFGLGTYIDAQLYCYGVCTFRINGAFDEPGLWGTICAIYLTAFKLDLKSQS